MRVGTVKEIKCHEYRVGLTPACVRSYVARGHEVLVERSAGLVAGFSDDDYAEVGAVLVDGPEKVFSSCDMVVKVKEPQASEVPLLRAGQILFTYLHLAASRELTEGLLKSGVSAVAYETIETPTGALPCLKPMSEIAGRLSVQEGAKYLERTFGGRGVLLAGVPGVPRGKVGILGGGVVGTNACKIAVGMGADVTILDLSHDRLAYLDDIFSTHITTLYSTDSHIEKVLEQSDVVIGSVLIPGAKAPKLIRRDHLTRMKPGAVIVDVAIDQGGCCETSKPTSHENPVFSENGIVHYCVANMPGAVALSSTVALTCATLLYGLDLAENGVKAACGKSSALARGLNVHSGNVVHQAVADAFGMACVPFDR